MSHHQRTIRSEVANAVVNQKNSKGKTLRDGIRIDHEINTRKKEELNQPKINIEKGGKSRFC